MGSCVLQAIATAEVTQLRRARADDKQAYDRLQELKNKIKGERDCLKQKVWDRERELVRFNEQLGAKDEEISRLKTQSKGPVSLTLLYIRRYAD